MIEIKSGQPLDTGLNITPLVDIVFLLLIFFLLNAFFIQPEGIGVALPRADGEPVAASDDIVVVVEADGRVLLSGVRVSLDELQDKVKTALAQEPDRPVVIKADRSVVLGKAVTVMDRVKQAGARRLIIATESAHSP